MRDSNRIEDAAFAAKWTAIVALGLAIAWGASQATATTASLGAKAGVATTFPSTALHQGTPAPLQATVKGTELQ